MHFYSNYYRRVYCKFYLHSHGITVAFIPIPAESTAVTAVPIPMSLFRRNATLRPFCQLVAWLCRTYDCEVMGLTPRRSFAIKWLILRWVTVCGQVLVKDRGIYNQHQGQLSFPPLRGR